MSNLSPEIVDKLNRVVPSNPPQGSYVQNCLLQGRGRETLFTLDVKREEWIAHLDGYAIIPIEEYERLTGTKVPRPRMGS